MQSPWGAFAFGVKGNPLTQTLTWMKSKS